MPKPALAQYQVPSWAFYEAAEVQSACMTTLSGHGCGRQRDRAVVQPRARRLWPRVLPGSGRGGPPLRLGRPRAGRVRGLGAREGDGALAVPGGDAGRDHRRSRSARAGLAEGLPARGHRGVEPPGPPQAGQSAVQPLAVRRALRLQGEQCARGLVPDRSRGRWTPDHDPPPVPASQPRAQAIYNAWGFVVPSAERAVGMISRRSARQRPYTGTPAPVAPAARACPSS